MQRSLWVRPAGFWVFPVLVLCAPTGSPQSLGAQALGAQPQVESAIRMISSGWADRGIMVDGPALSGGLAVLGVAGIDPNQGDERATPIRLYDVIQEAQEGSAWKKGLVIGAAAGVALGILVHAAFDSVPCDSCVGTGTSAAEGTRLEFAVLFGLAGGGLGAFLGSKR